MVEFPRLLMKHVCEEKGVPSAEQGAYFALALKIGKEAILYGRFNIVQYLINEFKAKGLRADVLNEFQQLFGFQMEEATEQASTGAKGKS